MSVPSYRGSVTDGARGTGSVALAAAPAAAVFAAMLLLSGLAQVVVVSAAVCAQVAVLVVHALVARRSVRGIDRPYRAGQFLGIWSVQAGLTYLWAGDDSTVSAAVYILVGMVFATVATWFLAYAEKVVDEPIGPTDTRPLPVHVPDEQ